MKLNYFKEVKSVKELKKEYHRLVLKNHPDRGGNHDTMVAIVLEYEWALAHLFNQDGKRKATGTSSKGNYAAASDEFRATLDKLMKLEGLEIEVCGDWIWVRGNTYPIKDQLKAVGCFWASKKKCWYWKPADYVKTSKKEWDMEKIRDRFGSESFSSQGQKTLTA